MLLIDSGVLIAFFDKSDTLHGRAEELLIEHSHESLICPQGVLQEVIEFVRRADGPARSTEVGQRIIFSRQMVLGSANEEEVIAAFTLLRKYPQLSFCDAVSAALCFSRGIGGILSFDSDFDALPGLVRIH